jgi:hypothetical protein
MSNVRDEIARCRSRLNFAQRQLYHELIFGPSSRASLRQLEGDVSRAERDLG